MAKQTRIGIYGGFTPTALDTSAADKMRALAGLGKTVGDITTAIGKPMIVAERVKQAEIASADAGTIDPATGQLKGPVEDVAAGKWGAAQANAVARNTYESNVSVEMNNIVDSAATEFPDDIVGYQNKVQSQMQGLIGAMPEQYRGQAQNLYSRLDNPTSRKIADNERQKHLDISNAEIGQAADVSAKNLSNAAYAGNADDTRDFLSEYVVQVDRLVQQKAITEEKRIQLVEAQNERIQIQGKAGEFDRAIRTEDFTPEQQAAAGRRIVDALRENPDSDLSSEQNQKLLGALDTQVTAMETANAKADAKITRDEMIQLSNLDIQIDNQDLPAEELAAKVYELFDLGVIKTDTGISSRIKAINKVNNTERKRNVGMARAANQIKGVDPVGDQPYVPATNQDFDNLYEDITIQGLSANPDVRRAEQATFVQRSGYVPKLVKQEIQTGLISQDPEEVANAYRTITQIQEIPGVGENAFSKNEIVLATHMDAFIRSGISPEDALQMSKNIIGTGSSEMKARSEARLLEIKDDDETFGAPVYSQEITKQFTGMFDSEADFQQASGFDSLVSDYGKLVEGFYRAGSTVDQAKDNAARSVQANWGNGEFGLMKYPPEQYYKLPVTDDTSYIRTELQDLFDAQGMNVNAEDIFLQTDATTSRQASSGQPSYRIMIKNEYGALEAVKVVGPGLRLTDRFVPDVAEFTRRQNKNILANAEQGMNPLGTPEEVREKRSELDVSLGLDTPRAQEDRERMRKTLQSGTSYGALIAKGVKSVASIPSLVTPENMRKLVIATGLPVTRRVIGLAAYAIMDGIEEASNDYVKSLNKKPFEVTDEVMDVGNFIEDPSVGSNPINADYAALKPSVEGDGLNITEMEVDAANEKVIKSAVKQKTNLAKEATNVTKLPNENKENIYSAVEMVESGGDVNAVSSKGAIGPMQLMPATAKKPGFGIKPARDNSPAENRRVGREYLDALLSKYSDNLDYALIAYNWGLGNTDKWIKAGADKSNIPKETRDYLVKVSKELKG